MVTEVSTSKSSVGLSMACSDAQRFGPVVAFFLQKRAMAFHGVCLLTILQILLATTINDLS